VRTVPFILTTWGMTLWAGLSVSTVQTETTTCFSGSTLRLAMVCSATMIWAADHGGVDAVMRLGGMAALAGDGDLELVGGGHHRAGADGEGADRNAGHVVHAVDLLDVPAVHHAILHHLAPAAAALFGGLEDADDGAVEIAVSARYFAAPSSIAVWPSWPQACILPGVFEA
jgi:hypothetical protein